MRAMTINEYGNSDLPAGAANDPHAPYNQKDYNQDLALEDGELVLYTSYEKDGIFFDPKHVDELLARSAGIRLNDGESIEIYNIDHTGEDYAILNTSHGDIDVDFSELENLS